MGKYQIMDNTKTEIKRRNSSFGMGWQWRQYLWKCSPYIQVSDVLCYKLIPIALPLFVFLTINAFYSQVPLLGLSLFTFLTNRGILFWTSNLSVLIQNNRTVKHWKWCTWHQKASAKNSSKLNKFLHSEVNQLIQHTKLLSVH